jgi:hypothetical protein
LTILVKIVFYIRGIKNKAKRTGGVAAGSLSGSPRQRRRFVYSSLGEADYDRPSQ